MASHPQNQTPWKTDTNEISSYFFTATPREIRNMIYAYAYPAADRMLIISRELARERALYRRYDPHDVEPKGCPLLDMVVCRQWYVEAVEEWFRERTIWPAYYDDWVELCSQTPDNALWKQKLRMLEYTAFGTGLPYRDDNPPPGLMPLTSFPRLCSLQINVRASFFRDCISRRRADAELLLPSDFASMPGIEGFIQSLAQAKSLVVRLDRVKFLRDEIDPLKENVKAFERWMQAKVKALQETAEK